MLTLKLATFGTKKLKTSSSSVWKFQSGIKLKANVSQRSLQTKMLKMQIRILEFTIFKADVMRSLQIQPFKTVMIFR